jgi:hypothetical protein
VIDQSQFNVNLSAFLDQNDFVIETFEERCGIRERLNVEV